MRALPAECDNADSPADEDLAVSFAALEAGWVSSDEIRRADEWRQAATPRVGKLAMSLGKMTVSQTFDVLSHQAVTGRLFGEVAIELGFLTLSDVYEIVGRQSALRPSLLDALSALNLISPQQALQLTKASTVFANVHSV